MRRREFLAALGGSALLPWSKMAHAQKTGPTRRVGVLMGVAKDSEGQARADAFEHGLRDLGWLPNRNVQVSYVWAGGAVDLQPYVQEVLAAGPDAIVAHGTTATIALRNRTRTIPIVFVTVSDPLGSGLVNSLARPSGNITGFTNFEFSMGGKWIEILKEIDPNLSRALVLFNPKTAPYGPYFLRSVEEAAPSFKMDVVAGSIDDPAHIPTKLSEFASRPNGTLIVLPDIFTGTHRNVIISSANEHRLPGLYPFTYFVRSGGLISYGIDQLHLFQRSASYIDRVLKGAQPADLPVQQPTKFEFAINLKTAKMLGLAVPPGLVARADEVIE